MPEVVRLSAMAQPPMPRPFQLRFARAKRSRLLTTCVSSQSNYSDTKEPKRAGSMWKYTPAKKVVEKSTRWT